MNKETNIWTKFIWTSEKIILMIIAIATLYATGIEIIRLIVDQTVNLSDLFLLLYMQRCWEWLVHFMQIIDFQ